MISFVPWTRAPAPRTADGDDAALAARIGRGDAAALDAVYRREAGAVYRYLLALAPHAASAADATQDAFIAFSPHGFDAGRGPLSAYLAGIGRHALLAQLRRHGGEVELDADTLDGAEASAPPDALLVARQDDEALRSAIRALPWPFREALVRVDLQERP